MLIALTGLHSAGKSYLANNIMAKYGFEICSKKDLVRYICEEKTGRENWQEWYKEEFNKNAYEMTRLILSYLDLSENIVLDAVHSDLEWNIITSLVPGAELIGIITPNFIRKSRMEEGDLEKDKKRIGYWHNGGGCLMTELNWTFNGGASLEINQKLFEEFLLYTRKKNLAIQGQSVKFSDKKDERLQSLIIENKELEQKIENINRFIDKSVNKNLIDIEEKNNER